MATASKKPVKKSAPKKKAAPKKTAVKKTVVAKAAPRSKAVSFATKSDVKFMQARFSEQTVYWLIIGAAVIGLAIWVLSLQVKLDDIYDQIDAQSANQVVPTKKTAQ